MYIKEFHIKNFKALADVKLHLNADVNIFTGINNSGKTTVLEAISLWHECFTKLIHPAGRGTSNYKKGDFVFGNTLIRYFQFDQINSVRSPNFEDIFYQRDKRKKILLSAILVQGQTEIEIPFVIGAGSGQNYDITLENFTGYDFTKLNNFFNELPQAIGLYYASPNASIQQREDFTTPPAIQDAIINRNSVSVLRNRLYMLYNYLQDPSLFQSFVDNLSYVLYNNKKKIALNSSSNIQRDKQVIFLAETNGQDVPKDIALLGSGTLQIMEILLDLYHSESQNKDLTIVLLDEPDSHIHRDIQSRLVEILTRFSTKNQIFLTTHNSSLISSANNWQLFHLEEKPIGDYRSFAHKDLLKQGLRFSGIFPSVRKPLISSLLGDTTGLDFINALESDVIIFTEGEDDARVIDILLKQKVKNQKKYAYWILGGITEAFERIQHYQTVFSKIKNQKTLWEKAILIIDRDYLNDEHQASLADFVNTNLSLETHLWSAYTIESTLMTDLSACARLIEKWLNVCHSKIANSSIIEKELNTHYALIKTELTHRFNSEKKEQIAQIYRTTRDKINSFSTKNHKFIKENDISLGSTLVPKHIESCLSKNELYKLMNKNDVEKLINDAIQTYGISFRIDQDFISLIAQVDKSTWQFEWDFLLTI